MLRILLSIYILVSTDCEALLKKFLALNPAKRYTLEQIMKDKWMNANEDEPMKPFVEPSVELNDKKVIGQLMTLGYKMNDIESSLTKRKFDEIFSAYLLLSNNVSSKLSRSKPASMTSIASSTASALPATNNSTSPTDTPKSSANAKLSETTTTNGEGLKETSFMTSKLDDKLLTASIRHPEPPSPELTSNNFKRQHTIGPESLKERNALRLHSNVSGARPISATPKVNTERGLQKSPVKPLRAFKPESSLSTTAQTPRRPTNNINVYKKVEPTKDATSIVTRLNQAAAGANSSSSSGAAAFQRNGPSRYTFHSGQSRLQPRDHTTLDSKVDPPAFGKGNFLQRLTTRFSKRFRLSQTKAVAETPTSATKN
jgi:hypothetical protein